MFDKIEIVVRGGDGGDGAISFRREKFVPYGGPDGGNGGDGGDVIIMADVSVTDLRLFRRKKVYRAGDGSHGKGQKKHGKQGRDMILRVPAGTLVWNQVSKKGQTLLADLKQAGQQAVVARGGKGGWGNVRYVSSTNQVPLLAQRGGTGEEIAIVLELRLLADVGIIGYPNVGKSTLLSVASAAKPKIADYPFTTMEPVLGVVEVGQESFIVAEIPGLIDGAHQGRGLGHDFLRHVMRTKILLHLIDGSSPSPVEEMIRINTELSLFDPALAQKPQLVVVNKVDLPEVQAHLTEIREAFKKVGTPVFFISAAKEEGIRELMAQATAMLNQVAVRDNTAEEVAPTVFRPQPRAGFRVHKEGDTFVVMAPELERIVARVEMARPEVRWQFRSQLAKHGVSRALLKAGVKAGDKVRCGNFEWEW